ncbi:MAG TPA: hypothetical protein VGF70_02945 [Solirubrobacteraceae bacterium]|jgi:hypothetical protein
MRCRRRLLGTFAIAGMLACSGCGSVKDSDVIRGWAQALTAGNLDRAASYFATPALVENGTPPVRITSRREARAFNELLPCGARLVATARHGVYTYATFRLTDRVGGACGAGVGERAATAFLIRDGKIEQWRRLPTPGGGQQALPPGQGQGPAV